MFVYVNCVYFIDYVWYEIVVEYWERICLDVVKMMEYLCIKVEVNLYVFVWFYGEVNGIVIEELKKFGYDMFFIFELGLVNVL